MKLIDFIILVLCISFVCLILFTNYKKAKANKKNNLISCQGSCSGCSGCLNMKTMLNKRKAH